MTAGGPRRLRLSGLLGAVVVDEDGRRRGVVHDVTAAQTGPVTGGYDAAVVVTGVVVGARGVRARLGLSPAHIQGPLLARVLSRLGTSTERIPWDDVVAFDHGRIVVRRARQRDRRRPGVSPGR